MRNGCSKGGIARLLLFLSNEKAEQPTLNNKQASLTIYKNNNPSPASEGLRYEFELPH